MKDELNAAAQHKWLRAWIERTMVRAGADALITASIRGGVRPARGDHSFKEGEGDALCTVPSEGSPHTFVLHIWQF